MLCVNEEQDVQSVSNCTLYSVESLFTQGGTFPPLPFKSPEYCWILLFVPPICPQFDNPQGASGIGISSPSELSSVVIFVVVFAAAGHPYLAP
jgi:hypothetical protein